jgi:hypothetical protein
VKINIRQLKNAFLGQKRHKNGIEKEIIGKNIAVSLGGLRYFNAEERKKRGGAPKNQLP